MPARMKVSYGFTPAAPTLTNTCPASGFGVGTSFSLRTSGPPNSATWIAFISLLPCLHGFRFGHKQYTGLVQVSIEAIEEHESDLKILGKLYQPWPPYPEAARAERRRGQLYLSVVVNPDGSVSDVQISKPLDELLDKPAVEMVRTWRFKVSRGRPTRFSVTLSFRIPCLDCGRD